MGLLRLLPSRSYLEPLFIGCIWFIPDLPWPDFSSPIGDMSPIAPDMIERICLRIVGSPIIFDMEPTICSWDFLLVIIDDMSDRDGGAVSFWLAVAQVGMPTKAAPASTPAVTSASERIAISTFLSSKTRRGSVRAA